jgi:N-dimethylarginine dimethylaminohydrolase
MSPPRRDWRLRGRANPFSQHAGQGPSGEDAVRDWLRVADAIEAHGGHVVVMPAAEDAALTGLPYTAEAGVMGRDALGPLFLVAHLTPAHRLAEGDIVERCVRGWQLRTRRVVARFEGQGDVLRIDDARVVCTFGEGPYARTVRAAFEEVGSLLPTQRHLLRFRADPWFHGNTFLGAFTSSHGVMVLVCEEAIAPEDRAPLRAFLAGARVEPISKEESVAYATNALQVSDTVLVPTQTGVRIRALFESHGLRVHDLALPALFSAGGGAAVCLTNRLDGVRIEDIPLTARFTSTRALIAQGVA